MSAGFHPWNYRFRLGGDEWCQFLAKEFGEAFQGKVTVTA